MGGAEIDADRVTPRVRVRRLARFRDLQERHASAFQGDQTIVDVGGKTLDEHQRPHLLRGGSEVVALVERAGKALVGGAACSARRRASRSPRSSAKRRGRPNSAKSSMAMCMFKKEKGPRSGPAKFSEASYLERPITP